MSLLVVHTISKIKKEGPVEALYHLLKSSQNVINKNNLDIEFEIISFYKPDYLYYKKFEDLNINIHILNSFWKLLSFIDKRKKRETIIHSHCTRSLFFSIFMRKSVKVHSCQVVIGIQAIKMHGFFMGTFINLVNKGLYHFQNKLIFSSAAVKKSLSKSLKNKGIILYNFISSNKITPNKREYLITISRLSSEKNVEELIQFHHSLKLNIPLLIVGDGPEKNKIIQRKGKNKLIKILGFRDDIEYLISNCLAYVSSSKTEGLPMSVLQAISGSKPVLLSNIDPHKELVDGNGYLYALGDFEDYQKKLLTIIDNFQDLGLKSKQLSNYKFDPEKISSKYLNFILK